MWPEVTPFLPRASRVGGCWTAIRRRRVSRPRCQSCGWARGVPARPLVFVPGVGARSSRGGRSRGLHRGGDEGAPGESPRSRHISGNQQIEGCTLARGIVCRGRPAWTAFPPPCAAARSSGPDPTWPHAVPGFARQVSQRRRGLASPPLVSRGAPSSRGPWGWPSVRTDTPGVPHGSTSPHAGLTPTARRVVRHRRQADSQWANRVRTSKRFSATRPRRTTPGVTYEAGEDSVERASAIEWRPPIG